MGQTVIEINGVKYDATTGSVISESPSTSTVHQHPHKQVGNNIDGIVTAAKPSNALQPQPRNFKPSLDRQVHDVTMVHHRQSVKSKTLMRAAVKKPVSHVMPMESVENPKHVQPTASYKTASLLDTRLGRASEASTHADVSRFRVQPTQKLEPIITHLPIASQVQAPHKQSAHNVSAPHSGTIKQGSNDFIAAQLAKQPNTDSSSPFKKTPLKKKVSGLFKGKKLRSIAATASAGLLLGGFIAYQNLPSISLAFANKNAGISAKIPKGIPSNFAISRSVEASKGQVTLLFSSRTDDRKFTITQQTSEMNSSELEQSLAKSYRKDFQSYDSNGLKLYITGPGEADWVDGGMRINISGKSGLSSEQLATIARSL